MSDLGQARELLLKTIEIGNVTYIIQGIIFKKDRLEFDLMKAEEYIKRSEER